MPVISTRRYSSYLTSSTTPSSSSGVGSYRSTSSSSTTLPSSTSRYSYGSSSSSSSSSSSYRSSYISRYDFDENNNSTKRSTDSLSTRIGVSSKNSLGTSRYTSDTLPPLPPSSSSITSSPYVSKRAFSRVRDSVTSDSGISSTSSETNGSSGKLSLMDDLDFYEKYSPSRYMTKYEVARARSHSDAGTTLPSRETTSPASSTTSLNVISSTHTPKSEVIALIS